MLLDSWRGFGETMSDTVAGATERWTDGRYAEVVKSNSSESFWIWAHQRETAPSFMLGQLGKGRRTAPRMHTGAGVWEQGRALSLHRTARAPEAAVELPGAQVKRFIAVA